MSSVLVEAALRALVLALLVAGSLMLMRVRNVLAQKLAWAMVLISCMLMPLAMYLHLGVRVPLPWRHSQEVMMPVQQSVVAAPAMKQSAQLLPEESESAPKPIAASRPLQSPVQAPTQPVRQYQPEGIFLWMQKPHVLSWMLYGIVFTVLLVRLLIGVVTALRIWQRAEPIDRSLLSLESGAFSGLRLRSSAAVQTPVTIGHGVLLPEDYASWSSDRLRIVLAHEDSHVRQGDFYLQLIAGLYAVFFWFSPLGWWLKHKLSDLSETISDHAGMSAAVDGPGYAQVLLEFAARPRPTIAGVAMAKSSNLARRIERLLSEHSFAQSFTGGRMRLLAVSVVVPVALIAATAGVQAAGQEEKKLVVTTSEAAPGTTAVTVTAGASETPQTSGEKPTTITLHADGAEGKGKAYSFSYAQDKNGESHAYVINHGASLNFSGNWSKDQQRELEQAQKQAHGDFLWFTHDGKKYVEDDPSTMAELIQLQAQHAITVEITNGLDADRLHALKNIDQAKLDELKNIAIKIDSDKIVLPPDFSKKMEEINHSLSKLQDRLGSKDVDVAELQKKLGDMQAQLGAMQGKLSVARVELAQRKDVSDQVKEASDMALRMGNVQVQMPDSREIDRKV